MAEQDGEANAAVELSIDELEAETGDAKQVRERVPRLNDFEQWLANCRGSIESKRDRLELFRERATSSTLR